MLYLGADHNGYFLKERLKLFLDHARIQWQDMGAFKRQKSDDYVDFAVLVGKAVKKGGMGLLVCGSGHGMVIAANKISGVRAIMPLSARSARDGRHDDHANGILIEFLCRIRFSLSDPIGAGLEISL